MSSTAAATGGTSSIGYNAVGDQMLRFDGGLDTNTDPFLLVPPKTTTATDLFFLSPGQVQALPIVSKIPDPTTTSVGNVYTAGTLPGFDPYTTGSFYEIAEVARIYTDINGVSTVTARLAPNMLIRDNTANDPKGPFAPLTPYQTVTRSAVGALTNFADSAYSGGQDYIYNVQTVAATQGSLATNITSGNLNQVVTATLSSPTSGTPSVQINLTDSVGSTTAQQTLVLSDPFASSYLTQPRYMRLISDQAVAGVHYLVIGGEATGGTNYVYVYTVRTQTSGNTATTTALTIDAGTRITMPATGINASLFDTTYINGQQALLAYNSTAANTATITYVPMAPTSNATLATTTLAGYNSAAQKVWPITTVQTSTTINAFTVGAVVNFNTTASFHAVMAAIDGQLTTIVVTNSQAFVSSANITIAGIIPQTVIARAAATDPSRPIGCLFSHQLENFTGLTAYGYTTAAQSVQQITACYFNNTAGTTYLEKTSYFRTQQGAMITGKAFTSNLGYPTQGVGVLGNPSESFMCPIVLGATGFDRNVIPQACFVLDQYCRVASRFSELLTYTNINTNNTTASAQNQYSSASTLSEPFFFFNSNDFTLFEFGFPFIQPIQVTSAAPPIYSTTGTTLTQGTSAAPGITYLTEGAFVSFFLMRQQRQGVLAAAAQKGKAIILSGGLTMEYDTRTLHESGFHLPAQSVGPTTFTSTGAPFPTGTYVEYVVMYTWTDATGQRHQSNTSIARTVNPPTAGAVGVNFLVYGPQATFKSQGYVGDVPVTAEIFRTYASTGASSYLYYCGKVTVPPGNNSVIGAGVLSLATQFFDTSTVPPFPAFTVPYAGLGSLYNEYSSDPPPPFISQITNSGRAYGLAQVGGSYRVYFTSLFSDNFNLTIVGQAPRWNANGYLTVPVELGDCRSIGAIDANIIVLGTNGIGVFNGSGPQSYLLTNPQSSVFNTQAQTNYNTIVPVPYAAGVKGCGSPITFANGLYYQATQGITLLDRSLNAQFVGKQITDITNVYNYGIPFLSTSLQVVVFPNISGPSLVVDYATNRFTQWNSLGTAITLFDMQNGPSFVLNGAINTTTFSLSSTVVSQIYPSGTATTPTANSNMVMETPWLPIGQGISGEGDMWDMVLLGKYFQPHTLLVETAFNYGVYTQTQTLNVGTDPTVATVPYQYRFRPQLGNRMQAVRYRITITNVATGSTSCECARITGIMMYSANYRGVQRTGSGVSR